ncbi:MAG TPA: DUF4189 domain-containing protein [Terracidiphilus sp.]|nr:DUF4189 domain-containing protein [Terracidiphilus sp.]
MIDRVWGWPVGAGLLTFAAILGGADARAQDVPAPGMEDACIQNLGYLACEEGSHPPATQQLVILHFAALAISPSTLTAGGAHGRNSQAEAEQTALQNCGRNGAKDCKVLNWAQNECVSLAVNYPTKQYGFSAADNRNGAANSALSQCRATGGKSCVVITAPCAGDDVLWSAPLPLPTGVLAGKVDPVMVGTWEMIRNPGRWIWRVAANGTYEFHSEAIDNTPSNAGTFTAASGHYTLHAITMEWDDTGTYTVQSQDVVVATGKLGTGTWKRIAR